MGRSDTLKEVAMSRQLRRNHSAAFKTELALTAVRRPVMGRIEASARVGKLPVTCKNRSGAAA